MTQPTGVFVRLPLSEERRRVMYDVAGDVSMETAILAIGTPVMGGGLIPIGEVAGHFSDGQPMVRILNHPNLPYKTEIALYSEAQAALAAAQAEIVRLREYLTSCTANLENVMTKMGDWCGENGPPEYLGPEEVMSAMDAYETGKEALKGPEA